MLCQHCRRQPAYWLCEPKWSETGVTVELCDGCMRQLKTVEGKVRVLRPLHDYHGTAPVGPS